MQAERLGILARLRDLGGESTYAPAGSGYCMREDGDAELVRHHCRLRPAGRWRPGFDAHVLCSSPNPATAAGTVVVK